ncbi:MAG: hypothetical protein P4M13_02585 [Alphaproteobacteria bacterium]|nr:hypothetical protein [Alphaproteobacteria bacterium]
MSGARRFAGVAAAFCAATLWLTASSAYSQEAQADKMLTLADCPAGWTLGVQDTAEPQPVTMEPKAIPANGTSASDDTGMDASTAPRRFITVCVAPKSSATVPANTDGGIAAAPVGTEKLVSAVSKTNSAGEVGAASPIGTGGMVFEKHKMGCYADRNKDGKVWLMPFFENNTGQWVDANTYETQATVDGTDVSMVCEATPKGLTVVLTAIGYPSVSFSQTWN